jgi:hypothetical protein
MSSSFQGTYLLLLAYFNSLYSLFLSSSPRLRQRQTSGTCVLITTLVFIVCSGVWSGCAEPSNETLSGI